MAYHEDLSTYQYRDLDVIELDWGWLQFRPSYERINVGWLGFPHGFTQGTTPTAAVDALLEIIAGPRTNVMRGFHPCSYCSRRSTDSMISVAHRSGTVFLGHSEIRVPSRRDVMFAAPSLIYHYVTAHFYLPPAEFIEAVLKHDHRWADEPSRWIPDNAERINID